MKQGGSVYPRLFCRDLAEEKKLIISVITPSLISYQHFFSIKKMLLSEKFKPYNASTL